MGKPKKSTTARAEVMTTKGKDSFLPVGYKVPKKSDQFLKLEPGAHKLRIMCPPIKGFVFFSEKTNTEDKTKELKPVRRTEEFGDFTADEMRNANAKESDGKLEGSKYFWILLVWNYEQKRFQVLEVTQVSILDGLMNFYNSSEYGDPRTYDVTITRTGTTKNNTEYSLLPSPPKALTREIEEEYAKINYNSNALMEGGYPFS